MNKSADGNRHRVAPEEGPAKVASGECIKETITVDLAALLKKFVEQDCPNLMQTLELGDEPLPLWWTSDFINGSKGECWTNVPAEQQKWVVGEFNCSCVGISKCLPAYCKADTPEACYTDIPADDLAEADRYGSLMGCKALGILDPVDTSTL